MKQHRIKFNGLSYTVEYCYNPTEAEHMKKWFGQYFTASKWVARVVYWLRVRRDRANDAKRRERTAKLIDPIVICDTNLPTP